MLILKRLSALFVDCIFLGIILSIPRSLALDHEFLSEFTELLTYIGAPVYFFFFNKVLLGSVGMKIFRLKVVNINGKNISWRQSGLRWSIYFAIFFVVWLYGFISGNQEVIPSGIMKYLDFQSVLIVGFVVFDISVGVSSNTNTMYHDKISNTVVIET